MRVVTEGDREVRRLAKVSSLAAALSCPGLATVGGVQHGLEFSNHPCIGIVRGRRVEESKSVLLPYLSPALPIVRVKNGAVSPGCDGVLRIRRRHPIQVIGNPRLLFLPRFASVRGPEDQALFS